jgi:hypothetical protein
MNELEGEALAAVLFNLSLTKYKHPIIFFFDKSVEYIKSAEGRNP